MNYVMEINEFNRFCDNHHLPTNCQIIWYKLMDVANSTRWKDWVQIDNKRLMDKTQIKAENTLIKNRDILIDKGLIEFKKGGKGYPNRYKMISVKVIVGVHGEVQTDVKTEVQTDAETADIYKEKEKEIYSTHKFNVFETLWQMYPVKRNKARVTESSKTELEELGLEKVEEALNKYINYVVSKRKSGFDLQYQDGYNWFNTGFRDYLEKESNQKPVKELVFKDAGYL